MIVSYDAVGSATRMTQRIGRTGRKRSGRVVTLVTKEEKKKQSRAKSNRKRLDRQLAAAAGRSSGLRSSSSSAFRLHFNRLNPRMLPEDIYPSCEGKDIAVGSFRSSQVAGIGMSQSDPRRKKAMLKHKFTFESNVSDSQKSFLQREFGLRRSSSRSSVGENNSIFSGQTSLSSDGDLDASSSEDEIDKILLSQTELLKRKIKKKSARLKIIYENIDGRQCPGVLQGGAMSSLRSKTLVGMLKQVRNVDDGACFQSQHDSDQDAYGSQDDDCWDNEMVAGFDNDDLGYESCDSAHERDVVNQSSSPSSKKPPENQHADEREEASKGSVLGTNAPSGINNASKLNPDSRNSQDKCAEASSLKPSPVSREVSLIEGDGSSQQEINCDSEDAHSTLCFQVHQKVQVFDSGKWWCGYVKRKFRKILSRKHVSKIWYYDILGAERTGGGRSWSLYDVHPSNMRSASQNTVHWSRHPQATERENMVQQRGEIIFQQRGGGMSDVNEPLVPSPPSLLISSGEAESSQCENTSQDQEELRDIVSMLERSDSPAKMELETAKNNWQSVDIRAKLPMSGVISESSRAAGKPNSCDGSRSPALSEEQEMELDYLVLPRPHSSVPGYQHKTADKPSHQLNPVCALCPREGIPLVKALPPENLAVRAKMYAGEDRHRAACFQTNSFINLDSKGSVMNASHCWVHEQCALYNPDSFIDEASGNISLAALKFDRVAPREGTHERGLVCGFCSVKVGSCVHCQFEDCTRAYHVTCAQENGLTYDDGPDPNNPYYVLCYIHRNCLGKESRQNHIDDGYNTKSGGRRADSAVGNKSNDGCSSIGSRSDENSRATSIILSKDLEALVRAKEISLSQAQNMMMMPPPPPAKPASTPKGRAHKAVCLVQGLDDEDEDSDIGSSSSPLGQVGGRLKRKGGKQKSPLRKRTSNMKARAHRKNRFRDESENVESLGPGVEYFVEAEALCNDDESSSSDGENREVDVNSQGYDANDSFINDGSIKKRRRKRRRKNVGIQNDSSSDSFAESSSVYSETCSQMSQISIDEEEEAMHLRAKQVMESPSNRGLGLRHLPSNGVLAGLMGNLAKHQQQQHQKDQQLRKRSQKNKKNKNVHEKLHTKKRLDLSGARPSKSGRSERPRRESEENSVAVDGRDGRSKDADVEVCSNSSSDDEEEDDEEEDPFEFQ